MEFLVEFDIQVPKGTPQAEVEQRMSAEAAGLGRAGPRGHLVRLWRPPAASGERKAPGLYRADSDAQLDGLLDALPLSSWMQISVTPLEPHPNDPKQFQDQAASAPRSPLDADLPPRRDYRTGARSRRLPARTPPHRAADRRNLHRTRAEPEAHPGRQRRLADGPARWHRAGRHPLHAADRRGRPALRRITRCASRLR
jgi:muconolactone D-isomerase